MPDDLSEGVWEFYDSWAAFPHNRIHETDRRIVGEFAVSLARPEGGTLGEFGIRFYEFHQGETWRPTRIAARMEAFGDSWRAIASNPGLMAALAVLGANEDGQGPDEVRRALLAIGMTEVTAKLRGTHRSICPTCRGTGQLDETSAPASAGEVHRAPDDGDGLLPCCGHPPGELSRLERLTNDDALVTCSTHPYDRQVCTCGHPRSWHNWGHGGAYCASPDPSDTCVEFVPALAPATTGENA